MDKNLKLELATLHAHICSALSSPNRILIICLLSDGPKTVGEITEALESPQSTTSRHLKILEEKGLVHSTRKGQFIEYTLADERVVQALQILRNVVTDMLREQAELVDSLKNSDLLKN